jgi:hypothetical protein
VNFACAERTAHRKLGHILMKNNRKEPRQTAQLEKKLAAYAIAGAAAFVAPGIAKADITYVSVNQVVTDSGTYDFNLSGVSSDDITISADSFEGFPEVDVSQTASGAAVLLDGVNSNVTALGFGALINPSATNWGSGGKMASSFPPEPGDWSSTGGSAYLGFYFQGPSGPQAGWADIATTANTTTSSFEILSYAYETNPNVAITAGEGSPVPEPSALPLLVLGAAGLIALRRRRAANA